MTTSLMASCVGGYLTRIETTLTPRDPPWYCVVGAPYSLSMAAQYDWPVGHVYEVYHYGEIGEAVAKFDELLERGVP